MHQAGRLRLDHKAFRSFRDGDTFGGLCASLHGMNRTNRLTGRDWELWILALMTRDLI